MLNARKLVMWTLSAVLGTLVFASAPALALNQHVYNSSFGSEGSGDGQFSLPQGVAVEEIGITSGEVYVVDRGNNRVEVFSSTGAYISQFDGSATPAGAFSEPEWVAIDNSTDPLDPSAGDVYVSDAGHDVVDKFSANGTYLGQISAGAGGLSYERIYGVAVDSEGLLWVYQSSGEIDEYSDAMANQFLSSLASPFGASPGLAVDSEDDLYVRTGQNRIAKLDSSGAVLNETVNKGQSGEAVGVTVDLSTNDVYVDEGTKVSVFGPSGTSIERFGSEHLEGGRTVGGVVVGSSSEVAYVADIGAGAVRIFDAILLPDVTTGEATNLQSEGSATLNGAVNPDGVPVTACEFEYGTSTSYGLTAPCSPAPGAGTSEVAVSANLALSPGALYHYRLVATNANGENRGEDRAFTAAARPSVAEESLLEVGSTAATIKAQVVPGGTLTSYGVEYGTSLAYGSTTSETSAGAGLEAARVQVSLAGLVPETVYHARIFAKNRLGMAFGEDLTFATAQATGAAALVLPDERAYEMVSPLANADGNVYVPTAGAAAPNLKDTVSDSPYRAAAEGNAVVYAAEPQASGGNGSVGEGQGNEFLATRGAGGWKALDVQPSGDSGALYQGFSSDLGVGALIPSKPLSTVAPPNCAVLYSRTSLDGAYVPAFTMTQTPGRCGGPVFAGFSGDELHLIFESEAALVPGAVAGNSRGEEVEHTYNLYDSAGGRTYLVNVLPNGTTDPNATFGRVFGVPDASTEGPEEEGATPRITHNFEHVISNDGSRIMWTDLDTGDLYVRLNADAPDASTVEVSAGGNYWGASSDGSRVFFTKAGDLYEYDLDTATTTDLAPGGEVMGVAGISADGSHVYFVAGGVLASEENANGEHAEMGSPNLYILSGGATSFIARLSPEDDTFHGPSPNNEGLLGRFGDWRASLSRRTAGVAPDGHSLVFRSRRELTGYDNNGPCRNGETELVGCPEAFVYDADTQRLSCASCNPTGVPPVSDGAYLPSTGFTSETYMIRWISEDGSRVFFDTSEPLVPQDTNGVLDVYEWEREGAGGCARAGGCIGLISGNTSQDQSFLVDASVSGDDVFFTTRGQLVPQDGNENVDLYDARVHGGLPSVSLECTGSGCQGVPPAPPIFATPSSVTFNGVGNFEPPPPKSTLKIKAKASKCRKGRVRKHGVCVKRKAKKTTRRSKKGRK